MNIHLMGRVRYDPRIQEEEEEDIDGVSGSISADETSSGEEDSRDSSPCSSMSSSSDLAEDASSSSSSSSNGPLHDLSELMNQLPIKRGLSKFYEGKSQSFTSLANVKSIEDMVKKKWNRSGVRMKACKSSCGLFDQSHKKAFSPKPTISKKATRAPSALSLCIKAAFINQNPM